VSCATATSCVAVGQNLASNVSTNTLVETLSPANGHGWYIAPSANVATDPVSALYSVSCPKTVCFAVGYSNPTSAPVLRDSTLTERP
jgi:hypothetical protein